MKKIHLLLIFIFLIRADIFARITHAEIGVDGFTCSICARSVENAILGLSFVSEVKMDLNKNIATVFFREGKAVSIRDLADKVYDSGFSVRYIQAEFIFENLKIENFSIYREGADEYHFLETGSQTLNGAITVIFLNKKLISNKEHLRWERWIKEDTRKNGKKENVYYVTTQHG